MSFAEGKRKNEYIFFIFDQNCALKLLNGRSDQSSQFSQFSLVRSVLAGQLPRDRLDNTSASFRNNPDSILGWRKTRRQSDQGETESKPEQMFFVSP